MFSFYRIHLKTRDAVSTARWYMDHLSARKLEDSEGDNGHNILLDVDGTEIIITRPPDATSLPVAPPGPHLGLEHFGLLTDDLDGLLAKMQAKGVELIHRSPDRGNDFAFVRAPDGVRLELVQR